VNASEASSQRAQAQSRTARNQNKAKRERSRLDRIKRALAECNQRLAFSPFEFGHVLGRSETWAYRQLYNGTVKAISDAGRLLIPRSELDRFLARTAEYNPKPKPKPEPKAEDQQDGAGRTS
jgi:glutathione S-transferase